MRKPAAVLLVLSLAVVALALVPAAGLAAKGGNGGNATHGGGGGGGGAGSTTSTLTGPVMVTDTGTAGLSQGDTVTFDVSTTATDKPYVLLNCYVSGTWVSTTTAGFFPESPWAPNFTLASSGWTSGAGNCTATLYMVNSHGKTQNLASLSFDVDA